jgi:hypothetical protein
MEKTYQRTVLPAILPSGFTSHDFGDMRPNRGETTSPGDCAQLALRLWRLTRRSAYLDDVERIVRSRILPSQILSSPLRLHFENASVPPGYEPEDLVLGAFGGMHQHPYGHPLPTTDITAANVHALSDVCEAAIEEDDAFVRINLHLDRTRPRTTVQTDRGASQVERSVSVSDTSGKPVLIRVPSWTRQASVVVTDRTGALLETRTVGDYLAVSQGPGCTEFTLRYPLPRRETHERLGSDLFTLTWSGDTVVDVRPSAPFMPFYPGDMG